MAIENESLTWSNVRTWTANGNIYNRIHVSEPVVGTRGRWLAKVSKEWVGLKNSLRIQYTINIFEIVGDGRGEGAFTFHHHLPYPPGGTIEDAIQAAADELDSLGE